MTKTKAKQGLQNSPCHLSFYYCLKSWRRTKQRQRVFLGSWSSNENRVFPTQIKEVIKKMPYDRRKGKVKTCLRCGKVFFINANSQKFCSRTCQLKFNDIIRAKKTTKTPYDITKQIKDLERWYEPSEKIFIYSPKYDCDSCELEDCEECFRPMTNQEKLEGFKAKMPNFEEIDPELNKKIQKYFAKLEPPEKITVKLIPKRVD